MEFPPFISWTSTIPLSGMLGGSFFISIQILIEQSVSKHRDPDQTPHSAASGLGLHCLPTSHKKDTRLIWVKVYFLKVVDNIKVVGNQH